MLLKSHIIYGTNQVTAPNQACVLAEVGGAVQANREHLCEASIYFTLDFIELEKSHFMVKHNLSQQPILGDLVVYQ